MGGERTASSVEIGLWTYIHNGAKVYEVIEVNEDSVMVRNICTEDSFWLPRASLFAYKVIEQSCPDTVDTLL